MTATEDAGDHGHGGHLPAVEDFPRGFGEASWWPFVTAIGGSGIYVGAALFLLAARGGFGITMGTAAAVSIGSIGLFVFGILGWLYHGFVASFWERHKSEQSESKLVWGMYAFLGSEIATFSAGFIYFFFIQAGGLGEIPDIFGSLVIFNTLLLIASSFVLHFSEVALRNGNRKRFIALLGATLLMGVIFIGGQVYEYYEFLAVKNFTPAAIAGGEVVYSNPFASAFYALTGLHGLHVTLGAVLLGIVFVRGLRGQYSAERHVSLKTAALYWHFVDVVWIFLVAAIYIGATAI
ncbi:heme-copper oxidase subunit III [Halorubellus litoreus]|uniref:Heme-copper oxidase subunit III n=1 Tax=Halorubellus litoreus TaxID=755308 RepID=A0ABD5V718_9EURY